MHRPLLPPWPTRATLRAALPLVCASVLSSIVAAETLQVRVRTNGAKRQQKAATFAVDSFPSLVQQVESHFGNYRLGATWWLADPDGGNVSTWEQVVASTDRLLSVVPTDKLFQWSPRRIGERFPIQVDGWDGVELETVASTPKIFLIHNLFTEEETIYLINRAVARTGENALQTSGVGFATTGARDKATTRTSASAFDADSPMAKKLIKRCFDVLRIPFEMSMADGLQILRYREGQAYVAHTDWFGTDVPGYNFDTTTPDGTNRFATVFLYLWPPPSGGFTVFPKGVVEEGLNDSAFVSTGRDTKERTQAILQASAFYEDEHAWELELNKECYSALAVKPVRLGASLFYHQEPMTGKLLNEATHGACPSLTGTKWGANLWIWNKARHLSKDESGDVVAKNNMQAYFVNVEAQDVSLEYSMDDAESWTFFMVIEAKAKTSASTYPGHYWRFTGAQGQEISRWVAPEDVPEAVVRSDGTHGKDRKEM